jgi:hypothetical protein
VDPHEVDFPRPSALDALPAVCAITGKREGVERVELVYKWSIPIGPVEPSVESVLANVRDERVAARVPLSPEGRRLVQRLVRLELLGAFTSAMSMVAFCALPILSMELRLADTFTNTTMIALLVSAPLPVLATSIWARKRRPRVRRKGLAGFALYVPNPTAARAYRDALWGDEA